MVGSFFLNFEKSFSHVLLKNNAHNKIMIMKYEKSVCWIRRDLRLKDHVALSHASQQSKKLAVVFVFDTTILKKLKKNDRRITFIFKCLNELDQKLRGKGSALVVLHGDPVLKIPEFANEIKAQAVFTNRDYEPSAKKRDKIVKTACNSIGIDFLDFKDQVIIEGGELVTKSGTPYKVFTPFKNAWLNIINPSLLTEFKPRLNGLIAEKDIRKFCGIWSLEKLGFDTANLWLTPGEDAGQKKLKEYLPHLKNYNCNRDYPALSNSTSGLSVHLRFGTLSIRSLVRKVYRDSTLGAQTWLSELVWREFYQMIMDQFPYIVDGCFKRKYDQIQWPGTNKLFKSWCEGKTGFPIIDAAMRGFNQTGWMHNRLRMIVASFLTKDLLVNWKTGEEYFAQNLLDFDLAANNGGWQWCASTGCDAQPWFRIFNPVTQSKKFDPEGKFIRKFLPEMAQFSTRNIHWPHNSKLKEQKDANCILGKDYPNPIVEHSLQRRKAIELFKGVTS